MRPVISKVFENLIFDQLSEYFVTNNVFSRQQYGFRKNPSTELTALGQLDSHNKKYHSGIRGIYITNTSTTMVFANEKNRFTTITVSRLLLPFP